MKPSIHSLVHQTMQEWVLEQGEKKFRADQIWEWLYRKRVQSFEEMTNLSKDLIAKLNDQFVVNPLKQRIVQESADGTVKYLFELPDGMLIETVLMRQHYGLSVCVTTQVGCNIGCTFCASGLIKKQRDLNNGEIVLSMMIKEWLSVLVTSRFQPQVWLIKFVTLLMKGFRSILPCLFTHLTMNFVQVS
ncbi:radical SAM enzyme, Cfr family [Streptococcus pneumoniae]|nr:radical SAM enzyme, Cfr family [Streptococcus pneumoniae]VMH81594.1 radical SAM enzyme, Cfr family [Streptococcus pneumoniae]